MISHIFNEIHYRAGFVVIEIDEPKRAKAYPVSCVPSKESFQLVILSPRVRRPHEEKFGTLI